MTEKGSILLQYLKKADKGFFDSFKKDIEPKEHDDDDIIHLFQCFEECTDMLYRPPQLSLEQILNFNLYVRSYEKNGYHYAFSTSVLDFYGKGKTQEDAHNRLLSFVRKSIRCGNGGIYPKCSSLDFESTFFPSLLKKMGDDDDGDNDDVIEKEINHDNSARFDKEDLSACAIRRVLERLLKCESKLCTLSNYNEWVKKGCPVHKMSTEIPSYCISLEDGNIHLNYIDGSDVNLEKISLIYY